VSGGRALVCAPTAPEHDRESGSRRVFHLIEFLREAGWSVACVVVDATGAERYVAQLQQRGVAVFPGPATRWVGCEPLTDPEPLLVGGRFDLALLHFWYVAEHYLPFLRRHSAATRVVVDSVDLHFLRSARKALGQRRRDASAPLLDARFGDETVRELNAYAQADAVLTVSQREADLVNGLALDAALARCVPDCEELPLSPVPWAERRGLLFVGNFRHPPNLEAVDFLLGEIVPLLPSDLLAAHPLTIVGNAVPPDVVTRCRRLPGVRCAGWVPALEPYVESSRVSLIPLLHGAGTQRKLVQALLAGTPSVVTPLAAEGLDLVAGEHALVATDAQGLAASIEALVRDEALWTRLQQSGRTHALGRHGREIVRRRFLSVIEEVLSAPTGA
jgi:O-antigen biosynthesis protein